MTLTELNPLDFLKGKSWPTWTGTQRARAAHSCRSRFLCTNSISGLNKTFFCSTWTEEVMERYGFNYWSVYESSTKTVLSLRKQLNMETHHDIYKNTAISTKVKWERRSRNKVCVFLRISEWVCVCVSEDFWLCVCVCVLIKHLTTSWNSAAACPNSFRRCKICSISECIFPTNFLLGL